MGECVPGHEEIRVITRFDFRVLCLQSRRYDSRTTIFSPDGEPNTPDQSAPHNSNVPGRLYQVEYAMEAIGHAGAALGVLATDGVVRRLSFSNVFELLLAGSGS